MLEDNAEQKLDRIMVRTELPREGNGCMGKYKVGIVGISEGAGASFLTLYLAGALAGIKKCTPAVAELAGNSIFDSMGLDKRFSGREFFHYFAALSQGRPIKGKKNMDSGINWAVASPQEECVSLDSHEKLMLINNVFGNVVLCDFSAAGQGGEGGYLKKLLQDMDFIAAVIDPMPSRMLRGYGVLKMVKDLEEEGRPAAYLINKFNGGVNKREMLGFLRVKKPVFLPAIQAEERYKAEYGCKNPYELPEIRRVLQPQIAELLHRLNTEM